jgi:GTPase
VSFRREKYVPRGGPDGGDGGRGGHIIIKATEKLPKIEHIRNNAAYKADDGAGGADSRKSGRAAADLKLDVPVGVSVFDGETGELLGDLTAHGDKLIAVRGGAGGRGNCHFATPRNRAPLEWEPGSDGEARELRLEYSIPAEAAVIGLPGSGKSSLVHAMTRSRTKIGEYAFTTLEPHLGVCRVGPTASFRILDLPALVDGSSEGRGIGNAFLRHLLRVKILIYLLDATRPEGLSESGQLKALKREAAAYDPDYAKKESLIVVNKNDAPATDAGKKGGRPRGKTIKVSALKNEGLEELADAIAEKLGITESWERS